MRNKVTVQDIADSLNLSRATVSKVLNNSAAVSEETRKIVLQRAREMNYNLTLTGQKLKASKARNFAFLLHANPDARHVGSVIMTQLEQDIRKMGYSLTLHNLTDEDLASLHLPPNLYIDQTEAIVCLEVFDPEYSRLLCQQGKPVLFIDACSDFYKLDLHCDLLMMENRSSVCRMLTTLCRKHDLSAMGFVGDVSHCLSFRERFEGFSLAALSCNVSTQPYSIIDQDRFYHHQDWIVEKLSKMNELPGLFFCANDVLAQNLILALAQSGYQVPKDVMVCGFDAIPTLNPIIADLTTVRTPSSELGSFAARILSLRIREPLQITCSTYLRTEILYRSTTQ